MSDKRRSGMVKWFDDQKGFGFIAAHGFEEDLFVHYSEIDEEGYASLMEGDAVTFSVTKTQKGLVAVDCVKDPPIENKVI